MQKQTRYVEWWTRALGNGYAERLTLTQRMPFNLGYAAMNNRGIEENLLRVNVCIKKLNEATLIQTLNQKACSLTAMIAMSTTSSPSMAINA
jgi:hypothetical protein